MRQGGGQAGRRPGVPAGAFTRAWFSRRSAGQLALLGAGGDPVLLELAIQGGPPDPQLARSADQVARIAVDRYPDRFRLDLRHGARFAARGEGAGAESLAGRPV